MSSWEIQPVLLDTLTYQGFDTASSFDKLYNKFLFSWAQKSKKRTITFVKSGHVLCSRCLKKWSQGRFKMWQHDHYLFPSGIHVQKFTVTPDWCAGKGQHAGLRQNWTRVNMVEITKYDQCLYTYLAVDLLQFTVLIEEQNQQRPLVLAVTRIFHNHALHYPFFPHVSGQKMAFGYWNTDLGTGNMNSCSVKAESPEVAAPAPGKGP